MTRKNSAGQRRVSIFGSTGSIGCSTLDVISHLGGREYFPLAALTGMDNVPLLAKQARAYGAELAVTADENRYQDLKNALSGSGVEAAAGASGLLEAAEREVDCVMAGIVGMAGLAPTLAAAARGADIALANKECLVAAGDLFKSHIRQGGGRLLPVDSEHNAIFQVFDHVRPETIERVILTASGGPFRNRSLHDMAGVTPEQASSHPNWSMGMKISIDSASMFNKALEMIEAMHLFSLEPDQIEVVIHPQSIIHSMVGYRDGSVLAQLGMPDMRTAIGYALTYPMRSDLPVERLDFGRLSRLDFEPPDEIRFPALGLARRAMEDGGASGAILNGAKEVALEGFIAGKIGFLDMAEIVDSVMERLPSSDPLRDIEDVYQADHAAREAAHEVLGEMGAIS